MSEDKKPGLGYYRYKESDVHIYKGWKGEFRNPNLIYFLNSDNIEILPPPSDTRSSIHKYYDDWKKRLSNAWGALKGYGCD